MLLLENVTSCVVRYGVCLGVPILSLEAGVVVKLDRKTFVGCCVGLLLLLRRRASIIVFVSLLGRLFLTSPGAEFSAFVMHSGILEVFLELAVAFEPDATRLAHHNSLAVACTTGEVMLPINPAGELSAFGGRSPSWLTFGYIFMIMLLQVVVVREPELALYAKFSGRVTGGPADMVLLAYP